MTIEKKSRYSPILALLLLCLSLFSLTVPRAADASDIGNARVIDEADLLTDAEEQELDASIAAFEKAHGVRILVGNIKDTHGQVLGKLANAVVDRIMDGGANGTIVFLVAPKDRDFYVSTDNKMRKRITDEYGIEYLADSFVPDLKDNEYGKAYTAFAATVDEMLTYYEKEGKPYDPANAFNLMAFGIALACALILGGTIYYMLYEYESNVTFAAEADAYLNHDSFQLTQDEDNFLYTTVTRKTKEKSSSSSSSGSNVSTSSSDSSHGGGGGKF